MGIFSHFILKFENNLGKCSLSILGVIHSGNNLGKYYYVVLNLGITSGIAPNRPFATNDHMVQNLPCWRASSLLFLHWDMKTKTPEPVKLDLPLFQCPSAGNNNELALQHGGFCTM